MGSIQSLCSNPPDVIGGLVRENRVLQILLNEAAITENQLRDHVRELEQTHAKYAALVRHIVELDSVDMVDSIMARVNDPTLDDGFEQTYLAKVMTHVKDMLNDDDGHVCTILLRQP